VRVEKDAVADINDWLRAMHGRSGPTALTVVRDKREVNLSISMPGRNRHSSLLPDSRKETTARSIPHYSETRG
jgi:hypothetical protein